MKGKTLKKMLAMVLTAASIMSLCGPLTAKAAKEDTNSQTETKAQTAAGLGEDIEPVDSNGFMDPNGEAAPVTSDADVSFGVVSDTHVTATKATEQARLKKAFEFYSNAKVDRMVVAGDLTDGGSQSEYDAWKSIKDSSLKIPLIASMGNHEGNSADRFIAATGNKPNENKVVNGYHFITVSPGSGTLNTETGKGSAHGGGNYTYTLNWLKEQLDAAVAEDPDKPVFVFFHHPIRNTFYVSNEWYGSGLDEIFKKYPQAVTFSGHIHSPNNMPTSIWQDGGYTAVNTVTLSYMEMETGMIYGTVPPNASQIAQGLVVEAEGSRVTIKNYDFLADQWIPQTWTFDIADRENFPYTDEREKSAEAPYFEEGAKVTVSDVKDDSAVVSFPQAKVSENNVGDIVHSYRYDFVDTKTGKVEKSFKTWSEYYFNPMPEKITQTAPDLEPGTSYEVRVYAIDAYQKISENYLSAQFTTTGENASVPEFDDMLEGVPEADLLDVDFLGGEAADHSAEAHTLKGSDGSNIKLDETLGKEAAVFTGKSGETFIADWSAEQYAKTNDGFTMESTFKVDKFSGSYVDVFGNMESAGIGIEISPNTDPEYVNIEAWVHLNGSYKKPIAAGVVKYSEWCHTVISYDGSKVTLYINGKRIASAQGTGEVKTPASQSQYYVIGGDTGSNGSVQSPMVGSISTARMYSEALTAKQVNMLANRELTALDTEKPIIQLSEEPETSGYINKEYSIPAATAADNSTKVTIKAVLADADGTEVKVIESENGKTEKASVKLTEAGAYTLQYVAADKAGNEEIVKKTVNIKAGNREKLDEAILKVLSIPDLTIYTDESVAVLMEVLQKVNDVTEAATQEEIDALTASLNKALAGLTEKPEPKPIDEVFEDVGADDWFTEAVQFVYDHKIMTGTDEKHFAPEDNLSRAQFATILYRMEGKPDADHENVFLDVPEDTFYTKAVLWANSENIISGYEDKRFGPADQITREQIAVMMYRYAKYKKYDTSADADLSVFEDHEDVSGFAVTAVKWAVKEGIISGHEDHTLAPQGSANRAECAAIIQRYMEKVEQ